LKRVEDILSEEHISLEKIKQEEDANGRDIVVAEQLYSYLRTPKNTIPPKEIAELKIRIQDSADKFNRRKNTLRWLSIASLLIFSALGGVRYFQSSRTSDIQQFANEFKENKKDTITRLVLNTGDEIRIQSIKADIKYDSKGEKINIDSDRKILQKLEVSKPSYNTIFVPYGKSAQITLSEGTKIWLNAGSKLVYPAVFTSDIREVYIDGEGIFEVTKDSQRPFVVKSSRCDIKVLGTVFNISAYPDDKYSYAVLKEGVIQMEYAAGTFRTKNQQILSPGDMATLNPEEKEITVVKVDPTSYFSWRDGYYIFKNERLDNILIKLSRYYNIELLLENNQLTGELFSGSLDLKNTPEEVLNVIMETTIFKYRKEGEKKIIIY
jgi:hypothetical protein